jgi:hypothetical protein
MKKHILRISLLCFLSALFTGNSFAQATPADSAYLQLISANFYKAIGDGSRLYNGHEYQPYDPRIKGNALFPYDAKTWATGEVKYDDFTYSNVPMMYDIYKDAVVVMLYNHFSMFTLLTEQVSNFNFSYHYFTRIEADKIADNKAGLTTGFYDRLYTGKIEILAKRKKTIQSSSNIESTLETFFLATDDYYLKKGNMYYKIGSKGSVLKILKDKKNELQKYLKQNDIRYGDNPEFAIVKMASYYDQITN